MTAENEIESRSEMPIQLGCGGSSYFQLRNGLWLVLDDYTFREARIKEQHHDDSEVLTAKFYLTGCLRTITPNVPGISADYLESSGQNSLFFLPDLREYEHSPPGQRQQLIKLWLEPEFLRTFSTDCDLLPPALDRLAEGNTIDRFYQPLGKTTPAMRRVMRDLLDCPFQGVLQQMYLEGNALKLLALQLGHWAEGGTHPVSPKRLQLGDLDRLHQAKDILTQNLRQPPSTLDLARQVGLNDYKLKLGFRQVFGTTVLGYVQSLRLVEAKRLLAERRLNIAAIAQTIGYTSQSHFCHLFKREFGVTPSEYRGRLWL